MTYLSKTLRLLAVSALLVNAGCGGGDSTPQSSTGNSGAGTGDSSPDNGVPVVPAGTVGGSAVGASTNTSFGTPAVAGQGMPFLYQNGFKVDAITKISPSGRVSTREFVTDTENNTITETGNARDFHEFRYDDQTGRVTEFGVNIVLSTVTGGLPRKVFYNDDGTVSGYQLTPVASNLRPYDKITYLDGQRQTHIKGRVDETGVASESISNVYEYSTSGVLSGSRVVSVTDGVVTNNGYDYTVNADGLVTSAQRIDVDEFDIQFSPKRIYFTFEYDENNNMVKFQNFTNEGELIRTTEISYSPTTEPTPNIAGFMIIREPGYAQVFSGYNNQL